MKNLQDHATLAVRLATAANFFSAVASRLGLWGEQSSGWKNFIAYAAEVNSFAPTVAVPFLAIVATILEVGFALLLLVGFKTRWVSLGAALLTFLFAMAMTYSFGIKSPLDYSVFVDSASALLLATMPRYRWSLDEYLSATKS